MLDQRGQQLQEARGLGSGVGVEQFLGLIHRQHQGGGGLLGGHIQQPGAGCLAGLLQPAPQPLARSEARQAFLISPSIGWCKPRSVRSWWMACGQAEFAGEHRPFGAHDGQRQEAAVVAAQPGQQPGPQKRRLARPRTGRG